MVLHGKGPCCDPSTRTVEADDQKLDQGHPLLQSVFKANLGYLRYCLKIKRDRLQRRLSS